MTVVMNAAAADGEPKATSRLNNALLKMNASFVTHTSCCEISIDVLMKKKEDIPTSYTSARDNSHSHAANVDVGMGTLSVKLPPMFLAFSLRNSCVPNMFLAACSKRIPL